MFLGAKSITSDCSETWILLDLLTYGTKSAGGEGDRFQLLMSALFPVHVVPPFSLIQRLNKSQTNIALELNRSQENARVEGSRLIGFSSVCLALPSWKYLMV